MTLEPGSTLPTLSTPPLSRMSLAYMTVAMRDPNLIHIDDAVAHAAGLGQVVAHGTFPVGYLGALLTRALGFDAIRRLSVDLVAPVFPGDVLHAEATVGPTTDDGAATELELAVRNGDGTLVARGSATVTPA